jgi:hypothetical protein
MLSTAVDLAQLAQAAPWLAVGLLALSASAWVYRQGRLSRKAAEERSQASARAQGKRLGDLERQVGMLDLRRRQVEYALLDGGVDLPYWPADGPAQPHPGRDNEPSEERRAPVPPLPDLATIRRHRR